MFHAVSKFCCSNGVDELLGAEKRHILDKGPKASGLWLEILKMWANFTKEDFIYIYDYNYFYWRGE